MLVTACQARRPVLVCGNGGSAADAMHIVGELVGRFLVERPAIRAIALSDNPAVITAWSNDYDFDTVFSRQVEAHAEPGGVLWGLSTSGNSRNVVAALRTARTANMHTLCMTGAGGGHCAQYSDILLDVPSTSTPDIQQVHICLYHYLCAQMEAGISEQNPD